MPNYQRQNIQHPAEFAERLIQLLCRYLARHEEFPSQILWHRIVANFEMDGPFVRRLGDQQPAAWRQLEHKLYCRTERKLRYISTFYQEEIISQTIRRVGKYLHSYLYLSRFSTWVYRIWLNEYLRLKPKIEQDKLLASLDAPADNGLTLGQHLSARHLSPQQYAERQDLRHCFYDRLALIADPLDVTLLKGRMLGLQLKELRRLMPDDQKRSVANISTRLKRVRAVIAADGEMRRLAREMG